MRLREGRSVTTISLIYISSAAASVDTQVLQQIASVSTRHNLAEGITGALLFHRGQFIQVLEGPRAAVSRCMQRIMRDERHHDVLLMRCNVVQERQIWEWSNRVLQSTPSVQGKVEELFDVVRFGVEPYAADRAIDLIQQLAARGTRVEALAAA
jgi:hypothetical protein